MVIVNPSVLRSDIKNNSAILPNISIHFIKTLRACLGAGVGGANFKGDDNTKPSDPVIRGYSKIIFHIFQIIMKRLIEE